MTISESIIIFLKRFETEGLVEIKSVETDMLKSISASYSLTKAPTENIKRYISGLEVHSDYYEFRARLSSLTEQERIDNQAWFEGLTDWIKIKNDGKDFPILKDGLDCQKIMVSSPFYMGQADEHTSVYSLTISIVYQKKG